MIDIQSNGMVDARQLHAKLELKTRFATWIERVVGICGFSQGKEFFPNLGKTSSLGGRPSMEYQFTIDAAKEACIVGESKKSSEIRKYLIGLSNKVETYKLLSPEKVALVHVLLNTFQYQEFHIEAQELHKERYKLDNRVGSEIHKMFAQYRNDLFGINNAQLKANMIEAFEQGLIHLPKAKNIAQRIFYIDKYKLVRNAVADLMISKGVNTIDALNFADTVAEVAKLAGVEIKIKNEETLFDRRIQVQKPKQITLIA